MSERESETDSLGIFKRELEEELKRRKVENSEERARSVRLIG